MPMAGRWDVQDIETQLSADPYSNPEIEADPTTEERLGVQWTVHKGTVDHKGSSGRVVVSQNADAGLAVVAYQGPTYQGLRVISGGLAVCATDEDFIKLLEVYFGQAVDGFGGMRFALSPFDAEQVKQFRETAQSVDPASFGSPCDTIAREMVGEVTGK